MINGGSPNLRTFTIEQPPHRLVGWRFYRKKQPLKLSARQAFWCTVQLLFWAKLPLKSPNAKSSSVFVSFLLSPNLLYHSGVFLCWLLFFHFCFFFPKPQQQHNNNEQQATKTPQPPFSGHLWRSTSPEPCWNGGFFYQWNAWNGAPTNVRFPMANLQPKKGQQNLETKKSTPKFFESFSSSKKTLLLDVWWQFEVCCVCL